MDLTDALERMVTAFVPTIQGPGSVQDWVRALTGAAVAVVADAIGKARAPRSAADTAILVARMRK
ncbi:hypothetical protein Srubr_37910 [Streptomyces rubradiris]|uniref:Uncharacterized protein n=1 Tax=Streptomyces rubradiris TaxID=285531 RepID=A0ABQ3RDK9_STRRR|nr:hypothetical protein Srubr_37910 [Streptomyces rubradiris]